MSVVVICDGCKKRVKMEFRYGGWRKPSGWRERADDPSQAACSSECATKITNKVTKRDGDRLVIWW